MSLLTAPAPLASLATHSLPQPSEDKKSCTACRRCCCRCRCRHCHWRWAGASAILYSLSKAKPVAPPAAAIVLPPLLGRSRQALHRRPWSLGPSLHFRLQELQRTALASGRKNCSQQGLPWLSIIVCLLLSSHLGFLLGENSAYLPP